MECTANSLVNLGHFDWKLTDKRTLFLFNEIIGVLFGHQYFWTLSKTNKLEHHIHQFFKMNMIYCSVYFVYTFYNYFHMNTKNMHNCSKISMVAECKWLQFDGGIIRVSRFYLSNNWILLLSYHWLTNLA